MSFAAEPYGLFVDDLVSSLTGGTTRERFRFLVEERPYRLAAGTEALPATVRVHGLVDGDHHRFAPQQDFDVVDGVIVFREDADGTPATGAVWPDRGTLFWASYERTPDAQNPPLLTDRNPGSVLRTLAEAFAREFSVLSLQLDSVYDASFLETATGRDLDQLAALVGIERRSQTFASGEVVFSRTSPAAADISIPEGTVISTSDVPAVTVETVEDATLRSGTLSIAAPVRAATEGAPGVASASTLNVIHRPILGITRVTNPHATTFSKGETDDVLRRRVRRALQTAGRSTVDALIGAVTSVEGVRERDVLVEEDHLKHPGMVKMTIAADLDERSARLAAQRIEEYRPAGIRVLHDLPTFATTSPDPGPGGGGGGDDPAASPVEVNDDDIAANRFPIGVTIGVTPGSANLTAADKESLVAAVSDAATAAAELPGLGEPLIYNRLVADVMAVDGVYDAVVDVFQMGGPAQRTNLYPFPSTTRVELQQLDITIRGALIVLDVKVDFDLISFAAEGDQVTQRANAVKDIFERLVTALPTLVPTAPPDGSPPAPVTITPAVLLGRVPATETYEVTELSYTAEFVDEGLRVAKQDVTLQPAPDQVVSVRQVIDIGGTT